MKSRIAKVLHLICTICIIVAANGASWNYCYQGKEPENLKTIQKRLSIHSYKVKRIICMLLVFVIVGNTLSGNWNYNVKAEETKTKSYSFDGITVTYEVKSEWDNHQAIEISVCNNTNTPMKNWALQIQKTGNMSGFWNCQKVIEDETYITVKGREYNNTIAEMSEVKLGYTLEGTELYKTVDIKLCTPQTSVKSNVNVYVNILGDWGKDFQGEIVIENNSEESFSGWNLEIDCDFEINNAWNGEVSKKSDNLYVISHTAWQSEIPAKSIYKVGFIGTKLNDSISLKSYNIYAIDQFVGSDSNDDSENEDKPGENPGDSDITDDINWEDTTDTDNDGLYDVYEIYIFKTDKNNSDTDGDGLTDGFEVYYSLTNPTLYDTDGNGICDANEDYDNDGLSNIEEVAIGTDPRSYDTDYDGLSDSEETNKYKTNPSKSDTDDDGIEDGDEIKLGLNPLCMTTDDIPDKERIINQDIDKDSAVLKSVNSSEENNPFEISLSVNASGAAESNISVEGSTFNEIIANDAMLGNALYIDYADDMTFGDVTITYEIDEAATANELDYYTDISEEMTGIKRLNVFYFDDSINMLLPIKTTHNVNDNKLSATMDKEGLFCLMDMEKWISNLVEMQDEELVEEQLKEMVSYKNFLSVEDVDMLSEDVDTVDEITIQNEHQEEKIEEVKFENYLEEINAIMKEYEDKRDTDDEIVPYSMTYDLRDELTNKVNTPVDIVVLVQASGTDKDGYWYGLSEVSYAVMDLSKFYSNDVRFSIVEQRRSGTNGIGQDGEMIWYDLSPSWDSFWDYVDYVENIDYDYYYSFIDRGSEFDFLLSDKAQFRDDAMKFVFYVPTANYNTPYYSYKNYMEKLAKKDIIFSECLFYYNSYGKYQSYMEECADLTGGKIFVYPDGGYNPYEDIYEFMVNYSNTHKKPEIKPQKEFKAVVATGYEKITLVEPLNDDNQADTDRDGLTDWNEVNTELISIEKDGTITLPTLWYCYQNYPDDSYVIEGLDRFKEDNNLNEFITNVYDNVIKSTMENVKVLPIHSDPTKKDSDGDGYADTEDYKPLSKINNGVVLECFKYLSEHTYEFDEYREGRFWNLTEEDWEKCKNVENYVTLLQEALDYLDYLSLDDYNLPGKFAGKTRAALQLYQLNHGLEPLKYGKCNVDINTFSNLINNAINHGMQNNSITGSTLKDKYDSIAAKYGLTKEYQNNCHTIGLPMSEELKRADVTVRLIQGKDMYHIYDYSSVLDKVIYNGEQEFHKHYYQCGIPINDNNYSELGLEYVSYTDSDNVCYRDVLDYIWMISMVKNNAKYDIKVRECWNNLMKEAGADVYFYGSQFVFSFDENAINAEDFGNILFGAITNAGGFYMNEMIWGGSMYSLLTTSEKDEENDSNNIIKGFELYNKHKEEYSYLHVTKRENEN